jgi:hypothetical protein
MDGASDQRLARSSFARDQDGSVSGSNARDFLSHLAYGGIVAVKLRCTLEASHGFFEEQVISPDRGVLTGAKYCCAHDFKL